MSEVTAQKGDTVLVHYIGKYPGGKVFDTSMKSEAAKAGLYSPTRDYKPLQVVIGAHQVISGFEEALVGMRINETKEVILPPEKAYGKTGRHPMMGKTLQFKLLVTNIKIKGYTEQRQTGQGTQKDSAPPERDANSTESKDSPHTT